MDAQQTFISPKLARTNDRMNRWTIRLLGDISATVDGSPIRSFGSQKSGLLLAYLAYHLGRRHAREELAELLWPDAEADASRLSLRVCLHALRQRLEPDGIAKGDVLLADRVYVQLNVQTVTVDAVEFERAVATALSSEPTHDRLHGLLHAIDLYVGEFLPGFYDDWVFDARARLSELYYGALREAVRLLAEADRSSEALSYAHRALALDELREEAHLEVIRLYALSGRTSAALKQYRALETVLREELGEEPSPATREAVGALLQHKNGTHQSVVPNGNIAVPRAETPACRPSLPLELSRFFGREEEIAWLAAAFHDDNARLVTITGPPGSGKTRTAVEFGRREVLPRSGAVWYVSLAEIADSGGLMERLIEVLPAPPPDGVGNQAPTAGGSAPGPDHAKLERIARAIGHLGGLVIFDNAEHLLPDVTDRVLTLLSYMPDLVCLVTSRQRLQAHGERGLPLAPQQVPPI
jgi:DNA-binding SARP family transcriptional activator